jgi:hypothetical protein
MSKFNFNAAFALFKGCFIICLLTFSQISTAQSSEGGVKFLFECDSMQTTILADQSISIRISEQNSSDHMIIDNYCSSKLFSLQPGQYRVSISSDKFCDEEVHNVLVCPEKVTFILLDLYRSTHKNCKSKKQFSSPVSTSCG